jgi:hypothetical protein
VCIAQQRHTPVRSNLLLLGQFSVKSAVRSCSRALR